MPVSTPPIPCKRPKVALVDLGHTRSQQWTTWRAECYVPGCRWSYENIAKTDVTDQAQRHRAAHRAEVPDVQIVVTPHGEPLLVDCLGCGFSRKDGTTTTRTDAEKVRDYHLTRVHGMAVCS